MLGSNKKTLLKAKRDNSVISHALTLNRRIIRVHGFVAREISLLSSQNLSFWLSASSVQPVQADVEHPQKETRTQALATLLPLFGLGTAGRKDVEKPCSTGWTDSPSFELSFSSGLGSICLSTSSVACARGPTGAFDRWSLLSFRPTTLGALFDGAQTMSSKLRSFPGSFAFSRSGESRLLVGNNPYRSATSEHAHSSRDRKSVV